MSQPQKWLLFKTDKVTPRLHISLESAIEIRFLNYWDRFIFGVTPLTSVELPYFSFLTLPYFNSSKLSKILYAECQKIDKWPIHKWALIVFSAVKQKLVEKAIYQSIFYHINEKITINSNFINYRLSFLLKINEE